MRAELAPGVYDDSGDNQPVVIGLPELKGGATQSGRELHKLPSRETALPQLCGPRWLSGYQQLGKAVVYTVY